MGDTFEFHAFCLSAMQGRAPLIFITVPGAGARTDASGFSTSSDVKRRLASLVDLRVSSLKFYPDSDLHKFLSQGCLRCSLANLLDPRVSTEKLYNLPSSLMRALVNKRNETNPSNAMSASQLQKAIGAHRLFEDD